MELIDKKYPYPVLTPRSDDYIGCSFDVSGDAIRHDHEVELRLKVELNCPSIQALVRKNDATIILHVECSRSAFRKSFDVPVGGRVLRISSDDVSGRISLCPFIVAQHEIGGYKSEQFNPIYQDLAFCIRCGAVLAEGIEKSVYVETATRDIDYKPDIFSVVPDKNMDEDEREKKQIKIDPCSTKIKIHMPTKAFSQYGALLKSGISNDVVLSSVILPAMMEALGHMQKVMIADDGDEGDLREFIWFNVVKKRILLLYPDAKQDWEKFVREDMSIVSVAQTLIKSPVVEALQWLSNSDVASGGDDEN